MRKTTAVFFVGLVMFATSSVLAQTPDAPRISYESVPDFIKMPAGLYTEPVNDNGTLYGIN